MKMEAAIDMFAALSQETRLSVFRLLVREGTVGLPAGEIARRIGTPANTMSTNLAILERCGLVLKERQGRSIIYRANLSGASGLLLYLVEDCCRGNPEVCGPVMDVVQASCGCAVETGVRAREGDRS